MTAARDVPTSLTEAWAAFDAELDLWHAAGKIAHFWWRDDDAADVTPALTQLLDLQQTVRVPLTLAVIPHRLTPALADLIATVNGLTAVQHGFRHENYAPAGDKKSEFPASRNPDDRRRDLREGQAIILRRIAPEKLQPILVPPWNRFAADLLGDLPALGFSVISTYRLRQNYWAAPGLVQLNTHLDPVDWRGGSMDLGCRTGLNALVRDLAAIRMGKAPPQPLGLLTHHLRHDSGGWDFIAIFLKRVLGHPAACWVDVKTALTVGRSDGHVIQAS